MPTTNRSTHRADIRIQNAVRAAERSDARVRVADSRRTRIRTGLTGRCIPQRARDAATRRASRLFHGTTAPSTAPIATSRRPGAGKYKACIWKPGARARLLLFTGRARAPFPLRANQRVAGDERRSSTYPTRHHRDGNRGARAALALPSATSEPVRDSGPVQPHHLKSGGVRQVGGR